MGADGQEGDPPTAPQISIRRPTFPSPRAPAQPIAVASTSKAMGPTPTGDANLSGTSYGHASVHPSLGIRERKGRRMNSVPAREAERLKEIDEVKQALHEVSPERPPPKAKTKDRVWFGT